MKRPTLWGNRSLTLRHTRTKCSNYVTLFVGGLPVLKGDCILSDEVPLLEYRLISMYYESQFNIQSSTLFRGIACTTQAEPLKVQAKKAKKYKGLTNEQTHKIFADFLEKHPSMKRFISEMRQKCLERNRNLK